MYSLMSGIGLYEHGTGNRRLIFKMLNSKIVNDFILKHMAFDVIFQNYATDLTVHWAAGLDYY